MGDYFSPPPPESPDSPDFASGSYVTLRITCAHVDIRRLVLSKLEDMEYICFYHKGTKTGKEHVHILVPDISVRKRLCERMREQGFKGNELISCKIMHNGLLAGIQYCHKHECRYEMRGEFEDAMKKAPKWKDKKIDEYLNHDKPDRTIRDWQLTYNNLLPQAQMYAIRNKMTECSLKEVVQDMISKTKWVPSKNMICSGVPDFRNQRCWDIL